MENEEAPSSVHSGVAKRRKMMVADTGEDTCALGSCANGEPASIRKLQLPSARAAIKGCLEVSGFNTLEVYVGECTLTIAMVWCCLPVFAPWDILFGAQCDVISRGWMILALIRAGKLQFVHLGSPCQSMTLARCPRLRSRSALWGKKNLSRSQQQIVDGKSFDMVYHYDVFHNVGSRLLLLHRKSGEVVSVVHCSKCWFDIFTWHCIPTVYVQRLWCSLREADISFSQCAYLP